MTVPDPLARAALLARLPAIGFVPPENETPWVRPALPARERPRSWAGVEPVAAWEPGSDTSSVSAAVAAFRATVTENEAEARRERFGRKLERVGIGLITVPVVVVIALGTVVVVFMTVCGCLGGLVR